MKEKLTIGIKTIDLKELPGKTSPGGIFFIENDKPKVTYYHRYPRKLKKALKQHRSLRLDEFDLNPELFQQLYGFNCSGKQVRKY